MSVTVCVGRAATITTNQLKSKGGREGGGKREEREEENMYIGYGGPQGKFKGNLLIIS